MYRFGYWNLLFLIANIKGVPPRKVSIWHDEGLWRALLRRQTWLQPITKMLLLAYDGMLLDTYFLWLVWSLTEVLIRNIRGKFPLLVKIRNQQNYAYKLQGLSATCDCEQPLISRTQTTKYGKIHRHAQDFEKMQHGNIFQPFSYHRYLPKLEPYLPFPLGNFDFNAFHAIMKPKILSPMVVLDRRIIWSMLWSHQKH